MWTRWNYINHVTLRKKSLQAFPYSNLGSIALKSNAVCVGVDAVFVKFKHTSPYMTPVYWFLYTLLLVIYLLMFFIVKKKLYFEPHSYRLYLYLVN